MTTKNDDDGVIQDGLTGKVTKLAEKPTNYKLEDVLYERKVPGVSRENEMLKEIANRLKPEGFTHASSFGIHIYRTENATGFEIRTQHCNIDATAQEASAALHIASINIAKSYGWVPSKDQRTLIKEE